MTRTFSSKVDWWCYATIAVTGSAMIYYFWVNELFPGIIFMLITWLCIQMLTHVRYTITADDVLLIELGRPLPSYRIPVEDIISIKRSRSLASSPALSMDRIEICYRSKASKNYLNISPLKKEEMVAALKKRNENIVVTL